MPPPATPRHTKSPMSMQTLDIVHELQLELGWDTAFATAAYEEYLRWLHLRANANDFKYCRLPPSRVVALVWNLHRQWTLDYENTCAYLGAFIHHFPPAMRMNVSREYAYAATVHMYQAEFNQKPPAPYWDVAVCQYRPDSSDTVFPSLVHADGVDSSNSPLEPKPFSRIPHHIKSKRKPVNAPATASKPAAQPVDTHKSVTPPEHKSAPQQHDKPDSTDTPSQTHSAQPAHDLVASVQKLKKQRKTLHTTPWQKGLMLKPTAPGEKRKRGRPSLSEYVPISTVIPNSSDPAQSKDNSEAPSSKTQSTEGQLSQSLPTATKPSPASAPNTNTAQQNSNENAQMPPAMPTIFSLEQKTVLQKRPRGRPRKDGSWPVARKQQKTYVRFGQSDTDLQPKSKPITDANSVKKNRKLSKTSSAPKLPPVLVDIGGVVEDHIVAQGCERTEIQYNNAPGSSVFASESNKDIIIDNSRSMPQFVADDTQAQKVGDDKKGDELAIKIQQSPASTALFEEVQEIDSSSKAKVAAEKQQRDITSEQNAKTEIAAQQETHVEVANC